MKTIIIILFAANILQQIIRLIKKQPAPVEVLFEEHNTDDEDMITKAERISMKVLKVIQLIWIAADIAGIFYIINL